LALGVRIGKSLALSALIISSYILRADVSPNFSNHLADLQVELQDSIQKTQSDIDNLLIKINRVDLAPSNGPESLALAPNKELRQRLKTFLGASIRMRAKHMEHLKKQKNYLSEDSQISQSILPISPESAAKKISSDFHCSFSPLKPDESMAYQLVFPFGAPINPALGKSSAKTQGIWWGNTFGALVRSCAPGEVVMSEFIQGRGHVVAIRHNSRDITLYGNLDSSSIKSLKTGMKIPEGAPLGFALERFYFEARRGSEAVNPDEIMSSPGQDSDAAFKIN
jgi:murein DD-endopeptidase MepM/ murein hydrolase activator NlpD